MVATSVRRTALVTGVGGQDGVLTARRLIAEGVDVVGTTRPGGSTAMDPYLDGVARVAIDLRDGVALSRLVQELRPDEIYHFAAISSVGAGRDRPEEVEPVNVGAVKVLLRSVREYVPGARVFLASTSEVFGPDAPNPQDESTVLDPQNPYATSKAQVHALAEAARAAGTFVTVGILYNHESPVRPTAFVTRKICRAAAEIASGGRESVALGNLHTARDWSAATDVVEAAVLMARADDPRDYVVASGQLHSIRDLVETAFSCAGVDDPWSRVTQDPGLMRAGDSPGLIGDASALMLDLGWSRQISFVDLVADMVAVDMERIASGVEEHPRYLSPRPRACKASPVSKA